MPIIAIWPWGSSPDLCIVCCQRLNEVAICSSLKSGRLAYSRIIHALEPSQRSISWKGSVCYRLLKKQTAVLSEKCSAKTSRRFREDIVSTILSTTAARSTSAQGLSCFCPKITFGVDDYSALHLFGQLLDGLLEFGWVNGSKIEPAEAEFHSFVREQRQVELSGNRSRVPINSVFGFCNQPSFRSWRKLRKVGIMVLQIILRFS